MTLDISDARERGGLLLAILALALLVVIVGLAAYAIWKAIQKLPPPRHIDPDDVAAWVAEIETNNYPLSGTLADGAYFQQVATNFTFPSVQLQRSTNMVDWETIAILQQDQLEAFEDTNKPWPAAFYRVRP